MTVLIASCAVLLDGLRLGQADRGDLGRGVGDARDAGVVDRHDRQAGDVLGDQDALGEADVRELQVRRAADRDQVADRVDAVDRRAQELVGDDEAALDA